MEENITFLKKHGVYMQFVDNFNHIFMNLHLADNSIKEYFVEEYLKDIGIGNPIYGAFVWSKTKEGYRFWKNIAILWDNTPRQ